MKALSLEELPSVSGGGICDISSLAMSIVGFGLGIASVLNATSVTVAGAILAGVSLGCELRNRGIR